MDSTIKAIRTWVLRSPAGKLASVNIWPDGHHVSVMEIDDFDDPMWAVEELIIPDYLASGWTVEEDSEVTQ